MQEYQVYLLLLPTLAYFVIFCYAPMYGAQIAFKDFTPVKGILGSPWVGFKHFVRFFENPYFWEILRNTFFISLYSLVAGFPLPILFAIMLNYQKTLWFKKCVQTVSFAPHFISTVVIVGMLKLFTSPSSGVFNEIIKLFGGQPVHFLAEPGMFYSIYVWSGIWQTSAGARSSTSARWPASILSCTRPRSSTAHRSSGASGTSTSPASRPRSSPC